MNRVTKQKIIITIKKLFMKTDTVNTEKWKFENNGSGTYMVKSIDDFWICGDATKADAELIVAAVNACKEINTDNPLKVAIGLNKLFKVLESVINDTRLPLTLYDDLSSIVDTLKSKF